MHTARIRKFGDPNKVIKPKDRAVPRGKNHYKWTDNPTYNAAHLRIRKELGKASRFSCPCGKQAKQWAYMGNRGIGERLPFSTNPNDYAALCVSCHKMRDVTSLGEELSQFRPVSGDICANGHEKTEESTYFYRGFRLCRECRRVMDKQKHSKRLLDT